MNSMTPLPLLVLRRPKMSLLVVSKLWAQGLEWNSLLQIPPLSFMNWLTSVSVSYYIICQLSTTLSMNSSQSLRAVSPFPINIVKQCFLPSWPPSCQSFFKVHHPPPPPPKKRSNPRNRYLGIGTLLFFPCPTSQNILYSIPFSHPCPNSHQFSLPCYQG